VSVRVAIIVGVLLLVLFVAGVCGGACSSQGDPKDAAGGPLEVFRGATVQPLDLDTVTFTPQSCRLGDQVVIANSQTCRLSVPRGGPGTRELRVVAGSGRVTLHDGDGLQGEDNGVPTNTLLPNSDTDEFQVYRGGGLVEIRCTTIGGCRVQPAS